MPVVLDASSTACPTQPQYAFYETAPGEAPKLLQGFTSTSTYTVPTSASTPIGTYEFQVQVRDATSTAQFDAVASTSVNLLAARPNDPFAAITQLPGMCTRDGWCWQWPTPTGNDLDKVFATDANNVWITGWHVVLQWNGSSWTAHVPPVPTGVQESQSAWAIGGTSPSNMYVLYGPNVDYWNGTAWTLAEQGALTGNPGLNNVWVAPDTGDAYVTLSDSTVEQFHNGVRVNAFTAPCGCGLYAIFGTSSHDIFITSIGGEMRFDGATNWSTIGTGATLSAWQGAANDVWVGGTGELGHWDGTSLAMVTLPASLANYRLSLGAYTASNDVWWYAQNANGTGAGADNFVHWDGTQFTAVGANVADSSGFSPTGVLRLGGTWWLSGRGGTLYTSSDDATVLPVLANEAAQPSLAAVWGTAATNMYYAQGSTVQHWDGASMGTLASMTTLMSQSETPVIWSTITGLHGLAGSGGADELYATAQVQTTAGPDGTWETVALHYDGQSWTQQVIETDTRTNLVGLGSIHIIGPGEAWAFSAGGTSHHFVNGAWTAVATTPVSQPFTSMWEQDASHVWLVGESLSNAQNRTLVSWDAANPTVFTSVQTPADDQCDTQGVDLFGQIFGIDGQPWIPSDDSCVGQTVMWMRGADGSWTETIDEVLGDGNSFHTNPRTAAPTSTGGIAMFSGTNVLFSNAGDTSTWRYDGSQWNFEDTGAQYGTPLVFAAPSGESFVGVQGGPGVLVHP
ncbi:MAG TPA: hypothetical protein VGG74_06620 [Kofleriaceae bacterium]|jgi:hypothetical protein